MEYLKDFQGHIMIATIIIHVLVIMILDIDLGMFQLLQEQKIL